MGGFQLAQLAHDAVLVVELELSLLGNLLGYPRHAADRGQRQRQDPRDQPHVATLRASAGVQSRSAKEYGGSGPISLNSMSEERVSLKASMATSKCARPERSTKNAAFS